METLNHLLVLTSTVDDMKSHDTYSFVLLSCEKEKKKRFCDRKVADKGEGWEIKAVAAPF